MNRHLLFSGVILMSLTIITGCSQWRVDAMKSNKFLTIPRGNGGGEVRLALDEKGIKDLTLGVEIKKNRVILADSLSKRVQVIGFDGKPEWIIGDTAGIEGEEVPVVPFNFSIIGAFTLDNEDNLYIQNRLTDMRGDYKSGISPSYILVFSKMGELQYTLGQGGSPGTPFYYIEEMFIDGDGNLFVISHSFHSWSVFRFQGKKRTFYTNLSRLSFEEEEDGETYSGKIENVLIFSKGDRLLISVAYYNNKRFKYRKVFAYDVDSRALGGVIATLPDPKNVLFNIVDDKLLYFWDIVNNELRFMITDMKGNRINTIQIDPPEDHSYYSKVLGYRKGGLYSYHIGEKGIDFYKWE